MGLYSASSPSPALQLSHLKLRNHSGKGYLHRGRLIWKWTAQPTPISRTYQLRIECDSRAKVEVFVDSPDICDLADGRKIPHLYCQEQRRLCLFLPSSGHWNKHKLLANTIVPWASLWLLYFEEWLWSDEWQGGGEHPVITNEKKSDGIH